MKKKIFSILFALVLTCSFSLVTATPVAAQEVPNPTFATVDRATSTTPSEQISIGWERNPNIAGDGYSAPDAIRVTTSEATWDYAMVIVPTEFAFSSTIPISYWGYTKGGNVKAPDEIFLFLDTGDDGAFDTLLTSHKPGPDASLWYNSWHEWNSTDTTEPLNKWHIVDPPTDPYKEVQLADYIDKDYTVLAIALTAGPSTTSGAVNVDVYFDRLTVNGNVLLDNDTGTIDVPEPFPGQLAPCIQDAIDAADSGDTINVAAGEYAGAVIDKDVTVSGAPGGASVITSGVEYKAGNPLLHSAFRPEADGAEIRNFTINCDVENDLDLGVYAVGVDGVTVDFLTINNGTIQGITNWNGSGWVITNNVITDTVAIGGGGIAIFLGAKAQEQCAGNLVQFNTIDATATAETYSCAGIAVCLDTRYGGYELLDDTEDVSGNQILDNVIMSAGTENSVGIEIGAILGDSETDALRTDEVAIAAIMAAAAVHDNLVQGNDIDGAETGVYFYNVTDLTVTQNEIVDSIVNGIYVEHGHSGVAVNYNNIYGNAYGLENDDTDVDYGSIDATNNWWGLANGPEHAGNIFNVGFQGDKVSGNVDYVPWLDDVYATGTSFAPVNNTTQDTEFSSIQAAIDDVQTQPGDTITVAAGTYNEQVVIDKQLTLNGATADVNKNGYAVPDDYAWDETVESIINHPNPSGGYDAIVDIVDVDNVTFEGFVVQELNAVGNFNTSLVRVYAHTTEISNIVVRNNVIGPNTNTTSQDGAQGRMGLYIVNYPYSDQYGVVNSTFSGNKIFDCKGNGNNVFLWSSYHAYGAAGPASMSGTVIEANEIYGAHRSGIETAGGFSGLAIRNNSIYGNSGPGDTPDLKYGNGIIMIRGSGDREDVEGYGPVNVTIEGNKIYNNEDHGIYMGPKNQDILITGNDIHDNGSDAVRVDLIGNYWNPDFDTDPGPYTCLGGSQDVTALFNNIYDNGNGIQVIGTPSNSFVLDATRNWWGHASGPSRALHDKWVGKGDKVSDNVNYKPWLHKSKEKIVPKKMPAYAQSVVLDNTGDYGWNTFSAPIFLDAEADTWKELCDLADLAYSVAYRFDSDIQEFVPLTTPDDYDISPGEGFFIKMNDAGSLSILYSTEENLIPPSRPLTAEWNLIGLASLKNMKVSDAFASIATVPGLAGYSQVVSPIGNAEQGPVLADGTIYVGESYWVYMLGERTLAGFTMTPVEWVP